MTISAGDARPDAATTWRPAGPFDLNAVLGPLRRGRGDPAMLTAPDGASWRATATPEGPASLRLVVGPDGTVDARAWGPGAGWAVRTVPELLGERDDWRGWVPDHPLLREVLRRRPGIRQPRSRRVLEALVGAVLEQRVTGMEARRAWRDLVRAFGTPAPGPVPSGLTVPPDAQRWAAIPSWAWHRAGVDPRRARTVVAAARVAARLEECPDLPRDAALQRLAALPGVGPWTVAEVAQRALGDTDAVSVGDFHLPAVVGVALTGERVDDAGMLRLLAPFRPFRQRAVRLIEAAGVDVPRFGPRYSPQDMRRM